MCKVKLLAAATFAGWVAGATALAGSPTSHHSVAISATIVEQGRNGEQDAGHTIRTVDNASILKGAIQFEGIPDVKPSDLDIVEEDDTGQIEIIYRAAPYNLFYDLSNVGEANETTSFATTEPTGFTQYRIYSGFPITLPVEGRPAFVGIEFVNHLNSGSVFKSSSASFRGGTATNASFQFVISGHLTTGKRNYVYLDDGED